MKTPSTRHLEPTESGRLGEVSDLLNELHASVELRVLHRPAAFRSRIASVNVAQHRYTLVSYGTAVGLDCHYDFPSKSTILCLKGSCVLQIDGETRKLVAGEGVTAQPEARLQGEFSDDCERLVIRSRKLKTRLIRRQIESHIFASHAAQAMQELITSTSQSSALLTCMDGNDRLQRPFVNLINQLLFAGMEKVLMEPERIVPGAVLRAKQFIYERAREEIKLADVARVAQVSERALQNQFNHFLRCSPMTYLRTVRLQLARQMLLGSNETSRVSSVALDCGFRHLARFAVDYRRHFGESPSETLCRGQGPR